MNKIDRRQFLKIMGWGGAGATLAGCDLPSTMTLQQGEEEVTSYVLPEEWVIPGVGVYYASTCPQCAAACGIYGRIREGRVLKAEGNPESPINQGKLCQMGQGGLQAHYNPDRLSKPLLRKGGALTEVSWNEAWSALDQKIGGSANVAGDRVAWVTGTVSGHQAVLFNAHLEALGSKNHFVHEVVNDAVWSRLNNDVLGEPFPHYRIDKAKLVLSFGADLMGASVSPVHFARMYREFRTGDRGMLIQVEPKMTLTGGSADLWLPVRPGTEAAFAMGLAYLLINKYGADKSRLPAAMADQLDQFTPGNVEQATGVPMKYLEKVARLLNERSPSLVIAGASTQAQDHGYESAAAAMLLNVLLGNVNNTIVSSGQFPFPQLTAKHGSTRDLVTFADGVKAKKYDVVMFYNTNPVFTSPKALGLGENLQSNVPFKVAFTWFPDETAMLSDLVIPLAFPYEDWGTHVPAYQPHQHGVISMQQPLMKPLYEGTKGIGDVLLTMLKSRNLPAYKPFADYYAYLRSAFATLPAEMKGGLSEDDFWNQTLQKGLLKVKTTPHTLQVNAAPLAVTVPAAKAADARYPYTLIPSARLGMWDGRHANIPWLQEAPDQIAKVVWGSWVELHPKTAEQIGVKTGDVVNVASEFGAVDAPVFVYKGIHPEAVAVPMGQGHTEYGRYAKGRGVNPMDILGPDMDKKTGELALFSTRVKISKSDKQMKMVKFGGSDIQVGRKLVATVTADQYRKTEGDDRHVI
jgi:anaerobic selenocysteine-containing dehydrogenase